MGRLCAPAVGELDRDGTTLYRHHSRRLVADRHAAGELLLLKLAHRHLFTAAALRLPFKRAYTHAATHRPTG